jgi:phosphopantothenoylcysteine synthetase/decarboxylase
VTFADLEAGLRRLLGTGGFDAVIHAAAVSDYAVDRVTGADCEGGKITSDGAPLLQLRPNPKLVDALRGLSPRPLTVVAFKLTHGADAAQADAAVRRLFAHSGADYVVHNDLAARLPDAFPSVIFRPDGTVAAQCADRAALAAELGRLLENQKP